MFFKKNMEYNQQQYLSKIKIQREESKHCLTTINISFQLGSVFYNICRLGVNNILSVKNLIWDFDVPL